MPTHGVRPVEPNGFVRVNGHPVQVEVVDVRVDQRFHTAVWPCVTTRLASAQSALVELGRRVHRTVVQWTKQGGDHPWSTAPCQSTSMTSR